MQRPLTPGVARSILWNMTHRKKAPGGKWANRKDEKAGDIVRAMPLACADEDAAVEFIERLRWGDSPACPRCGSTNVRKMLDHQGNRNARYLWRCYACKEAKKAGEKRNEQFTVRIGTVFEESRLPLTVWCYAMWRATTSKKGVAALEIQRQTGISYKSALFLMHRIRHAMANDWRSPAKLSGTIEADETFVGGKPRNRRKGAQGQTDKTPVFGMLERGGAVRFRTMTGVNAENVRKELSEHVVASARLITDEALVYRRTGRSFEGGHETVNHGAKEYVRGDVTTNTIEGAFSLLKRGLVGIWHAVSKEHLHRYLAGAEFRYNWRDVDDGSRVHALVVASEGARLRYRKTNA